MPWTSMISMLNAIFERANTIQRDLRLAYSRSVMSASHVTRCFVGAHLRMQNVDLVDAGFRVPRHFLFSPHRPCATSNRFSL